MTTESGIELGRWGPWYRAWQELEQAKRDQFLEKAAQYGGGDLTIMGTVMGRVIDDGTLALADGQAYACAFYCLGKLARAISAWQEGRSPSLDTLHDLAVYADMTFLCALGKWPT